MQREMADYEDDFEDYKDDFEDAPAPAPAPKPAPPAATRGAAPQPSKPRADAARAPAPAAPAAVKLTGRIRVGGAAPVVPRPAARAKAASGARTQVSRLLDVDSYVELFAMAPASAYEQLQEKVRLGAWRHASAQAPEETRGVGSQSEQLSTTAVGVQAPDDLGMATKTAAGAAAAAAAAAVGLSFDARVVDFLRSAGRIVEGLCEANLAAAARRSRQAQAQARPGAAPGTALGRVAPVALPGGALAPLLQGRAVQAAALSPVTPHTRLLVLGPLPPAAAAAAGIAPAWATATLVVVLERQLQPAAVLATYADVTAACFSPDATMVVAGTAEGAVVLWDLEGAWWTAGRRGLSPPLLLLRSGSPSLRRARVAAPHRVRQGSGSGGGRGRGAAPRLARRPARAELQHACARARGERRPQRGCLVTARLVRASRRARHSRRG